MSALTITQDTKNSHPAKSSFLSNVKNWILKSGAYQSSTFAIEFFRHPRTLGTPFVLSRFVATELLSHIPPIDDSAPRNYLEVGAGTGTMSAEILKRIRRQDHLHLVEIDKNLYEVLKSKFASHPNVFIYNAPIQDWKSNDPSVEHSFHTIVSTVPFNSLATAKDLDSILSTYKRLIRADGVISHAEYVGTSTLSQLTRRSPTSREAYKNLQAIKNAFWRANAFATTVVYRNLPPARVIHCS